MKIPPDAIIPTEKLTNYLLVPRQRSDKSKFLAQAGFTLKNPADLEQAIRHLLSENDAVQDRHDDYGTFFQVTGSLVGPNGKLSVVTVWMIRTTDDQFRFITLKPARSKS